MSWPIPVQDVPFNSFRVGRKTITAAGTPERLSSVSTPVRYVVMQALISNSGSVYWGHDSDNAKAATGVELLPGANVPLPFDNLRSIFLDVDTSGDGVSFFFPKNT